MPRKKVSLAENAVRNIRRRTRKKMLGEGKDAHRPGRVEGRGERR